MPQSGRVAAVPLLVLVILGGCLGGPAPRETGGADATATPGQVSTVNRANHTRAAASTPSTPGRFEDLSPDRRQEFLAGLEGDVRDPSQWGRAPTGSTSATRGRGTPSRS